MQLKPHPRVIPVLDLLGGQVVHGIAGDRVSYRPIVSTLAAGSDPLTIAAALCECAGTNELYVADLDGIQFGRPDWGTLRELENQGLQLCVDIGVQQPSDLATLLDLGVTRAIVALETSAGPDHLGELIAEAAPQRLQQLIFSLDLRHGRPITHSDSEWCSWEPGAIVAEAVRRGIDTVLVLDLAAVGLGTGIPTRPLCRSLKSQHPDLELWTGGGVRDRADLMVAAESGVDAVLVASALHTGRLWD